MANGDTPTIQSLDQSTKFLQQQIIDTRVQMLQSAEQNRLAILDLSTMTKEAFANLKKETRSSTGELKAELGKLQQPFNNRLTFATILSIVAVGLAVACFVQI